MAHEGPALLQQPRAEEQLRSLRQQDCQLLIILARLTAPVSHPTRLLSVYRFWYFSPTSRWASTACPWLLLSTATRALPYSRPNSATRRASSIGVKWPSSSAHCMALERSITWAHAKSPSAPPPAGSTPIIHSLLPHGSLTEGNQMSSRPLSRVSSGSPQFASRCSIVCTIQRRTLRRTGNNSPGLRHTPAQPGGETPPGFPGETRFARAQGRVCG